MINLKTGLLQISRHINVCNLKIIIRLQRDRPKIRDYCFSLSFSLSIFFFFPLSIFPKNILFQNKVGIVNFFSFFRIPCFFSFFPSSFSRSLLPCKFLKGRFFFLKPPFYPLPLPLLIFFNLP